MQRRNNGLSICIASRIDHSRFLAEELFRRNCLIRYITFGHFPGWLKNIESLLPKYVTKKLRNRVVNISDGLTISSFPTYILDVAASYMYKKGYILPTAMVHSIFEKYCINNISKDSDVLHYWSLYFNRSLPSIRQRYPKLKLLSDVYEAYPPFVSKVISQEYDKIGIPYNPKTIKHGFHHRYEKQTPLVVASNYVKQSFATYFPDKEIYVNPYGVYNPAFRIKSFPRKGCQKFRFIYCGAITIEKGCHQIFHIAQLFPQHTFTLVGRIDDKTRALFNKFAPLPNVNFMGNVPGSEINRILLKHDVYIHPSLSDAYSLAVSEALATGLPAIVSKNTGNREVIEEHHVGLVFRTGDITDLADKIKDINYNWIVHTNTLLRKTLPELTWERYVDRMLGIYERI